MEHLLVPRDRILIASGDRVRLRFTRLWRTHKLPTRGFSDHLFENSRMLWFQEVDSTPLFRLTFGLVWKCLEIFDLDRHILGTVKSKYKRSRAKIYFYFRSRANLGIRINELFDVHAVLRSSLNWPGGDHKYSRTSRFIRSSSAKKPETDRW